MLGGAISSAVGLLCALALCGPAPAMGAPHMIFILMVSWLADYRS
jgi:hypothetical protein